MSVPYAHPQLKPETFIPLCLYTYFLKVFTLANMVQVGDVFPIMEAARYVVQQHVLDDGELYKTSKSDKKRLIFLCKDT